MSTKLYWNCSCIPYPSHHKFVKFVAISLDCRNCAQTASPFHCIVAISSQLRPNCVAISSHRRNFVASSQFRCIVAISLHCRNFVASSPYDCRTCFVEVCYDFLFYIYTHTSCFVTNSDNSVVC